MIFCLSDEVIYYEAKTEDLLTVIVIELSVCVWGIHYPCVCIGIATVLVLLWDST